MGLINKINVSGNEYDIVSGINIRMTVAEAGTSIKFNPISAEDLEKLSVSVGHFGPSNFTLAVTMGDLSMNIPAYYIGDDDTDYLFMNYAIGSNNGPNGGQILASIQPQIYGINKSTGAISMYIGDLTINFTKIN